MTMKLTIDTASGSLEVKGKKGARLDDVILSAGIMLDRPCGGKGVCGSCKVRASGGLSDPSEVELDLLSEDELAEGYRLACETRLWDDAEVKIEVGRIVTAKSFHTVKDLDWFEGGMGLAIDLGTTTVAAMAADTDYWLAMAGHAVMNLQATDGAEIMSRMMAADKDPEALAGLAWDSIIEACNGLKLSRSSRESVETATLVGNTAMHHLLLKLPVTTLLACPFAPASAGPMEIDPAPLRKLFPNIKKMITPALIGGFVGSDALACVIYFGLERSDEYSVLIDLGTNGEVILAKGDQVFACSTAAGPAFEGVNISCGMRAIPGAITGMSVGDAGEIELETVDDMPPIGIAGSGLLSATAELIKLGAIETTGRIEPSFSRGGVEVENDDGINLIRLSERVYLSQLDVRELQKAKAAVCAAVEILMDRAGVELGDIGRVILTGSFGGRLTVEDIIGLGVIPEVEAERAHAIPNGAGLGAVMMLRPRVMERANELAGKIEHVELNLDPSFMDRYVDSMELARRRPRPA